MGGERGSDSLTLIIGVLGYLLFKRLEPNFVEGDLRWLRSLRGSDSGSGGLRIVGDAGTAVMGDVWERPFVSVVLPTRNRAHLLVDALGSVLEQDYPADRYEIVVVDDGSTDGTSRVVDALAAARQQPQMRLISQPPRNQNAARNHGLFEARGELIALLDDDELAPPGWLSGLVDGASRHPEAACLGGPYHVRFETTPPPMCERCWPGEAGFDLGPTERTVDGIASGNMLVRKRAADAAGPFDERLQGHGDETEWMHRLRRVGGRIVYLPGVPIWHRSGPDELRALTRVRKAFRVGRQKARAQRLIGGPIDFWSVARMVPLHLAHGVRRRCSCGPVMAASCLGWSIESLARRR